MESDKRNNKVHNSLVSKRPLQSILDQGTEDSSQAHSRHGRDIERRSSTSRGGRSFASGSGRARLAITGLRVRGGLASFRALDDLAVLGHLVEGSAADVTSALHVEVTPNQLKGVKVGPKRYC